MTDFSKIYILAEDARQQLFVLRYLYKAGFGAHVIDREPLPGRTGGAGEHWVRTRYPEAVKKYRKRAAKAKTALIVVIDADTEEVIRRDHQLEASLKQVGISARRDDEAIIRLIPRRNIETWILHLHGDDVDEEKDLRHRDVDGAIVGAATTLHSWASQPPAHCLPPLRAGIQELTRLA